MKKRIYAQEITKSYLEKLGITGVTPDGLHVYKNGKEVHQSKTRSGKKYYLSVGFYDSERYFAVPKGKRKSNDGQFTLGVHVINYVWNSGKDKPQGVVIDHIDNDPFNNHIDNLQPKTPKENLHKEHKDWCTGQTKCKLNKPLSFYEDKLAYYLALHEEAKAAGDKEKCHKLRVNISQSRKRINYWLAHKEEAEKLQMENETKMLEEQARHEAKQAKVARLRELQEFAWAARMRYLEAQHEYGADHFITQCCKEEWHDAVRVRNNFLDISE